MEYYRKEPNKSSIMLDASLLSWVSRADFNVASSAGRAPLNLLFLMSPVIKPNDQSHLLPKLCTKVIVSVAEII